MANEVEIKAYIAALQAGRRPVEHFLARTMDQLFYGGQYRVADLTGARDPESPVVTDLLSLVFVRDNRLQRAVLSLSDEAAASDPLITMRQAERRIPFDASPFGLLAEPALEILRELGLNTIAGLNWAKGQTTGERRVQLFYPKPFMDLHPGGQAAGQDLALGIAAYFLQQTSSGGTVYHLRLD